MRQETSTAGFRSNNVSYSNFKSQEFVMNKSTFSPAVKQAISTFLIFSVIFLLLIFRNPRLFVYPEPWAEDMTIFLGQEYNIGFPEDTFTLYAGYVHLLPRIISWIAMKFGMSGAMIVMTWTVLLFKLLTFYLIYKSKEITSGYIKFALLAYLVLQPFIDEIYNNVTNLQWWLIYLMAILLIRRETSMSGFIFSAFMLLLSGLTGVNSVIFAVPCAYLLFKVRTKGSLIKNSIVIACAFVQFYFLYTSGRSGTGGIVYEGDISEIINFFVSRAVTHSMFKCDTGIYMSLLIFPLFISAVALNLWHYRKNTAVIFILLFGTAFTAVVMYNFLKTYPDLNFLITGFGAERYFVLLRVYTFILLVSSIGIITKSLLSSRNYKRVMAFSCYLLCLVLMRNYSADYSQFGYQYYDDVAKFESAKSGDTIKFHVPPNWSLELTKK